MKKRIFQKHCPKFSSLSKGKVKGVSLKKTPRRTR
nr:MAG TPA_asm: hypothetical protein [Caudoviricetes sp.]